MANLLENSGAGSVGSIFWAVVKAICTPSIFPSLLFGTELLLIQMLVPGKYLDRAGEARREQWHFPGFRGILWDFSGLFARLN